MTEYFQDITERSSVIVERRVTDNGFLLLYTQQCPSFVRNEIFSNTVAYGTNWFLHSKLDHDIFPSRRNIYNYQLILNSKECSMILKEKKEYGDNQAQKVPYFTKSLIHEIRTSYALKNIVEKFPIKEINVNGIRYRLNAQVQSAFGGIINLQNQKERYGLFEYISGQSIREEINSFDGWNNTPESKRKLFGSLHTWLSQLANYSIDYNLEPFDLGIHQLVYWETKEGVSNNIHIGILDTEEYNFAKFGSFWPRNSMQYGLPPVALIL
jgi:hypothetical protein